VSPIAFLVIGLWFPRWSDENRHGTPPLIVKYIFQSFCLLAPLGTALGALALVRIAQSVPRRAAGTYAQAAVIVGILSTLALFVGSGELNAIRLDDNGILRGSCFQSELHVSSWLLLYAQDYDSCFPPGEAWNESIYPYDKNVGGSMWLECPAEESKLPSYALNGSLSKRNLESIENNEMTPLIFDSVPGQNRVGWTELLPSLPRHNDGYNFAFADGHVAPATAAEINTFLWRLPSQVKPASKPSKARKK
jgi:prepilin-type processing-associated H-X9-DG protein